MKVIMNQHYQDAQVHYLPGQVVEVGQSMAAYLLEHRMASPAEDPKPEPAPEPEAEQPKPARRKRPQ